MRIHVDLASSVWIYVVYVCMPLDYINAGCVCLCLCVHMCSSFHSNVHYVKLIMLLLFFPNTRMIKKNVIRLRINSIFLVINYG